MKKEVLETVVTQYGRIPVKLRFSLYGFNIRCKGFIDTGCTSSYIPLRSLGLGDEFCSNKKIELAKFCEHRKSMLCWEKV